MKVLIIEDEELAQDELERIILKRFPKFSIVAKLETVSESIAWLSANTADLIFLDIHLADGNGFDIFREIDVKTPIIFTTAYDRYAIDAFKVNGIGYLLKPIVESELVAAVNKLDYSDVRLKSLLAEMRPAVEYKSRIIVKTSNRVGFIRIEDIAYFYSEDRLTFAVERNGKKHVVEYTIESLSSRLNPRRFFKITRGFIVCIDCIKDISNHFNGRLKVTVVPEHEGDLFVSRARATQFMQWLDDS